MDILEGKVIRIENESRGQTKVAFCILVVLLVMILLLSLIKNHGNTRGQETYNPVVGSYQWVDRDGNIAKNKEVWLPYIYKNEEPGSSQGKWVRYDENGVMVKGWWTDNEKTYYYDPTTGAMAKGTLVIDDRSYTFDSITGELQK